MRHIVKAALAGAATVVLAAAPGHAQESPFNVEVVADGLAAPWSVAFLPDGSMLVTEKPGRLRVVNAGGLVDAPVSGLPDDIYYEAGTQAGLFDVVLHPDFASNRLIYLTYAGGDSNASGTKVVRGRLDGARLTNVEELFAAEPLANSGAHYGGRLAFLPDDTFVLTVGDSFIWRERAQRLDVTVGKMIRLGDDGSVPSDNPFIGQEDVRPEIYTLGHRSPQGLAYDAQTGVLYESEHGPWGGDELNIIEPGNNYGWPVITYGRDYSGAIVSPFTEYEGMELPAVDWTPVIAASGLAVYRGDLFRDWDGDVLAGGLGARTLVRVEVSRSGQATEAERFSFPEVVENGPPPRIRDVRAGPDGAIYVVTDDPANGLLLRLTPAR